MFSGSQLLRPLVGSGKVVPWAMDRGVGCEISRQSWDKRNLYTTMKCSVYRGLLVLTCTGGANDVRTGTGRYETSSSEDKVTVMTFAALLWEYIQGTSS